MSEPTSGFDAETRARIDCAEQFEETGAHLPDCPRAHHQQAEKLLALAATVAALTAENERLTRAQRDHFTLREELRAACETGMRLNLPAEQIVARIRDSLGADAARFAIRDRESRAALPSSRETTDGRTDPS